MFGVCFFINIRMVPLKVMKKCDFHTNTDEAMLYCADILKSRPDYEKLARKCDFHLNSDTSFIMCLSKISEDIDNDIQILKDCDFHTRSDLMALRCFDIAKERSITKEIMSKCDFHTNSDLGFIRCLEL